MGKVSLSAISAEQAGPGLSYTAQNQSAVFSFFEMGSYYVRLGWSGTNYVDQDGLKTQRSTCFYPPSSGIKGVLLPFLLFKTRFHITQASLKLSE